MDYTCRCGAFAAEIDITPAAIRAVCYCPSCRAFAEKTKATDALDPAGGSDLLQVAPENVRFLRGAEHLTWMQLTEKGPARWYTTCCNAPVANTLLTRAIPFVTLMTHRLADPAALPPVAVRAFRKYASQRVPDDSKGMSTLYWNFARRALKSRLSGGWKKNPFFDSTGALIASGKRAGN